MWKFVEVFNEELKNDLMKSHQLHSSDISNIEGFVMTDEEIDELNIKDKNVIIRRIPKRYQGCIADFIADYWDGDYTFERKKYVLIR